MVKKPETCAECPECAPVKGSEKVECTKDKRHWQFSKTLAKAQALCDDKTNTENLTEEPETQTEIQWVN